MLSAEQKQTIWHHLVGNYLTTDPGTIKQWSKRLIETLQNPSPAQENTPKGMHKYIDYQIEKSKSESKPDFAKELQLFKTECAKTIEEFNQAFETLLKEIEKEKLSEATIHDRLYDLGHDRKEKKLA